MQINLGQLTCILAGSIVSISALSQQSTIDLQNIQTSTNKDAAASQIIINHLDDQAQRAFHLYRSALSRVETLKMYNQQFSRLVKSQEAEINSIKFQTEEIETIESQALPLMVEMANSLQNLVAADAPFLRAERLERVAKLGELIDRADVTTGEKYRRIMECYLIEAEYGRTIDAYRNELAQGGKTRTVDFLRLGRVGLFYQTLDGKETGRWDTKERRWEVLSEKYRKSVRNGLRIARKVAPPALLALPFNAPEASS